MARAAGSRMSLTELLWSKRTRITRSPLLGPAVERALRLLSLVMRLNPIRSSTRKLRGLRYLNVGCGRKPTQDFVNLDYSWYPGVDLVRDLRRRLPFASSSLIGI